MHGQTPNVVLYDYLIKEKLKFTEQRRLIWEVFLSANSHLTIDDLYQKVKQRHPGIGLATVYRTIKLLCECGLTGGVRHGDGAFRYELKNVSHDHLICIKCGKLIEDKDPEIEVLHGKLAQKHNFKILHTRVELFGLCRECCKE